MNIGIKPTTNENTKSIEVNLFDFNQDLEEQSETRSPGWIRYQKRIK